MSIVDEMTHVDYLSICYRPRRNLDDDELTTLVDKLFATHHPVMGAFENILDSVIRYNNGTGLLITFKQPLTMKGLRYIISSITVLCAHP